MQHFLNLDKCSCGAYRYLAIREHKRSYEVYLIHHAHIPNSQAQRKYSKLASIPKHRLNIHDERINELTEEKRIRLTYDQIATLRSVLKEIGADPKLESMEVSEEQNLTDITEQITV